MSECQEQSDLTATARDTVVLILHLADREIANVPDRLRHALESEELARAIRTTLEAEGRRLAQAQQSGQTITNADGQRVLQAVGGAAATAVGQDVRQQIEASSGFHQAQQQLRRLEAAFNCSPMGIFVDQHQALLYIVASGIAIGSATALYVARTGDTFASWATDFAARRLRSIQIGRLEVGTEALRFVPSERVVEVQPFLNVQTWREVRLGLRLHGVFREEQVQTATAGGEIVVRPTRGVTATLHGNVGMQRPVGQGGALGASQLVYDAGLAVQIAGPPEAPNLRVRSEFFLQQDLERRRVGGAGTVEYDLGRGVSASLRGSGAYTQPLAGGVPGRGQTEVSVQAGLVVRFQ